VSYALRNTFILIALLAVVLGCGLYWVGVHQAGKIKKLQARKAELAIELEEVSGVFSDYQSASEKLDQMKVRWGSQKQIIPPVDTPDKALSYLDGRLKRAGGKVNFDFLYKGRRDEAKYSANVYALEGEGRFQNLFSFLWYLENGSRFFTVDRLQIDQWDPGPETRGDRWNWVRFRVIFRAYFIPQSQVQGLKLTKETGRAAKLKRNLFRPLITEILPENYLGLFDVKGARLKALTHDQAFLEDSRGEIHLLKAGERIYLGRLDKIDILSNRVEFVLDKGGIWERVKLNLDSDSAKK
jgi:hypothetical protein